MVRQLIGLGAVAVLAVAGAFGLACSSSSGGNNNAPESDAGGNPDVDYFPDASAWCYTDQVENPTTTVDECTRNPGDCPVGSTPVNTCPTANLAGCCKNADGGEVCLYTDSYLDVDGGGQAWCTCKPATANCYGGTWQLKP
jgi:hypothetical protein